MRQTEVTGVQTSKFLQKHLMSLIAVLAKVKQYPNFLNSEVQVTEISLEECLEVRTHMGEMTKYQLKGHTNTDSTILLSRRLECLNRTLNAQRSHDCGG